MCTVTYIPSGNGAFVTSNRDETRGRTPALAPSLYSKTTGRILFPRDSQAGGTWFAVHENGNTLVLLNGAKTRHQPTPPYRKSRGLVLLELADSDQPLRQFRSSDLHGIEPFTVVLLTAGQLHECSWDGSRKYQLLADASLPHLWSSVTLYDPATIVRRKGLFEEWLEANPSPGQEKILQFHARPTIQLAPAQADSATHRDQQVLTVSITTLHLHPKEGVLTYLDITGASAASSNASPASPNNSPAPPNASAASPGHPASESRLAFRQTTLLSA